MQAVVGLLDTDVMPIYMIISLDIVKTMRFFINCSTVICLPTVCYFFERAVSSENSGPRVYFNHIIKNKNTLLQFIYFYFTLQFNHLPIQDLILASNKFKGIDNSLARVGCKYLLLCVQEAFTRIWLVLLLVQ